MTDYILYKDAQTMPGFKGLTEFLSTWMTARRARKNRQRTLEKLAEMPDWQLRDVGINPSELHALRRKNHIRKKLRRREKLTKAFW